MIVEARRAARNERVQRARGGIEPAGDVYGLMQIAYPGVFLAMIAEGALRASPAERAAVVSGLVVFAAREGAQVVGDRDARRRPGPSA